MKNIGINYLLATTLLLFLCNVSNCQSSKPQSEFNDSTEMELDSDFITTKKEDFPKLLTDTDALEDNKKLNFLQKLTNPVITNLIQLMLLVLQILIIIFGLKQFRYSIKLNRRGMIYNGFIDIEEKINDKNKLIWGLNENDEFVDSEGKTHEYSIEEIKHMVQLIDLFAFERGQTDRYSFKPLNSNNVIYRMFQNNKFVLYWRHVVKPQFFDESRFSKVIDLTIEEILSLKNSTNIKNEEEESEKPTNT